MQRRRRSSKRKQHSDRWLITYSDLITLLLVFFVIMFAMSDVNKVRFESLAESLNAALHKSDQVPLEGLGSSSLLLSGDKDKGDASPAPTQTPATTVPQRTKENKDQLQLQNLYQLTQGYIKSHHLENQVSIANQSRGIQITMKDVALFDTGQAKLRPQAEKIIRGFVPFFKSLPNNIVVEGYTDNQPIHTSVYPSNWELSAARAMSVVHFLSADGINPRRLSGTGYGEYHNIKPNDTAAHRQANRRVNIVVLRQDVQPGTVSAQPGKNK